MSTLFSTRFAILTFYYNKNAKSTSEHEFIPQFTDIDAYAVTVHFSIL